MGWRAIVLGVVATATVTACGSDAAAPPTMEVERGIQFVTGNGITDSAGASLAVPLIIEVHDSTGARAPLGTVVRFESQIRDQAYEASVTALTDLQYSYFASGTTDGSGRTGVLVVLGVRPGPARISIVVPTLGIRDTARFTITPAAPARIDLRPADTAVFVGASFPVTGSVFDRYDNARSDAVTLSISSAGATVSNSGVVTTSAVGRYTISASALGYSQSANFSVVPPGVLTAFDVTTGDIVSVSLTGTNKTKLADPIDGGIGLRPRWVMPTAQVLYSTLVGDLQTLAIVDSTGQSRPFFTTRPSIITHAADPAPSADGAWVYFAAHSSNCSSGDYCLHRARLDGTGAETLEKTRLLPDRSLRPSPSPDGRRVAFQLDAPGGTQVRVLDVEHQQLSAWSIPGAAPLWSPNGQMIAYRNVNGDILVMSPDGSASRTVINGLGALHYPGIAWSPDSQWLMYHDLGDALIRIVNVQSGQTVPIPLLAPYFDMSWR